MKFGVFTIVLDGMRFLPAQFFTLSSLTMDWHWYVIEGAAANTGTTAWCKPQERRLSRDGTTEFLRSIAGHPRVTVIQSPWWPGGKDQMCQAALNTIKEPTVLLQCDCDELWTAKQMEAIWFWLSKASPVMTCARFDCVYMVGPNLRVVGRNCWGQQRGEFLRAWRFTPGMKMRHEPPFLEGINGPGEVCMSNQTTRDLGLVFFHWAYVFESQVAYKESFYGYVNATEHWRSLQKYTGPFPVQLKRFLPWVDSFAQVAPLFQKQG